MTGPGRQQWRRLRAALTVIGVVGMVVATGQPGSAAMPGDIVLASTSDSGVKSNGSSEGPSISADGGIVAFHSSATNLDPADVDTFTDVYVKNLASGEIVVASTSDSGVNGNLQSFDASVSADGGTVAFRSTSTNLDPADTDTDNDIYVKDLGSGDIVLVSTSRAGVKSNGTSLSPSLSADGEFVAFVSDATNLHPGDTDRVSDVYVKDLTTGNIKLASTSDTGVKSDLDSYGTVSLSADGSTVAFDSWTTNLDPADADSVVDVYVKDLATGDVTLASTSEAGGKGSGDSWNPSLSALGGAVAFDSAATDLGPGDADRYPDVYVKDLATGAVALASASDSGVNSNDFSSAPSLSANGDAVAFWSYATNLDPGDTENLSDAYLKDLRTGDIVLVSASDTGVNANASTFDTSLSADSSRVALGTYARNLDPADKDRQQDVYVKTLSPAAMASIKNHPVVEGDTGTRIAIFPVTLSKPSPYPVSVHYATADGTAVAGADYRAKTGTLTLEPGRTRAAIVIVVLGDSLPEPDETFTVELSNPSGLTIRDGHAEGTIRNDDA